LNPLYEVSVHAEELAPALEVLNSHGHLGGKWIPGDAVRLAGGGWAIGSWERSRLHLDRRSDSLRQPVQDIGPQRPGAFQEVAQDKDVDPDLYGDLLQWTAVPMNRSAQVAGKGVLGRGLVEPLPALQQLGEFGRDLLAITAESLQQLNRNWPGRWETESSCG
jgi:hypothetical protein